MINKPIKRNSVFWKMLITGLAPTLCSVLVLCIVFMAVISTSSKAVEKAQEQNLMFAVKETMDGYAAQSMSICKNISESPWFHELFIDYSLSQNRINARTKSEIISTLSMLMAPYSPDMERIAFQFFWTPQTLFTNRGVYENLSFYTEQYPDKAEYIFFDDRYDGFSSVLMGNDRYLLYSVNITDRIMGSDKARVNILFNEERVRDAVFEAADGKLAGLCILDSSDNVIWEIQTGEYSGEKCVSLNVSSGKLPVRYSLSIPVSVDRKASRDAIPLFLHILAIDLAACIFFAVYFSRRTYRPLKETVSRYVDQNGSDESGENEFELLNRVMDRAFQDVEESRQFLSELYPIARQTLYGNILDGTAFISNSEESIFSRCGIDFSYGLFNVICIKTDIADFFNNRVEKDKEMQLAVAAQEDFARKAAEGLKVSVYLYAKASDSFYIIVNYNEPAEFDIYINNLYRRSSRNDRPAVNTGQVIAACGEFVTRAEDIYIAADQAETALKYAVSTEKTGIVYYDPVVMAEGQSFRYSITQEKLLSGALLAGDEKKVYSIIDDIISSNRNTGSEPCAGLLYGAMCVTLIRTAREQTIELKPVYENGLPDNLSTVSENIKNMASELLSRMEVRKFSNTVAEDTKMLDYINEHIYDPELSLGGVADAFDRSTTSVSETFKKLTGFKYIDYVNRRRIQKAVELMYEQNLEMNKVYPMVGYVSLSTFRRNYKRFAGKEDTGETEDV